MPYKEKDIVKVYYSIGEIAEMLNVNTSLIRYWEKEFDIIQPHKNKKGNRLFTQKDVENLKIIYHLVKERGYTLAGANEKLKKQRDVTLANIEAVKSLKKIKSFLEEWKKDLESDQGE